MSADELCVALSSGDTDALTQVCTVLRRCRPAERAALLRAEFDPDLGAQFAEASKQGNSAEHVWNLLDALTDLRPPPVQQLEAHFSDAALFVAISSTLRGGEPQAGKSAAACVAACRCVRNLGRVPGLRRRLSGHVSLLVQKLTDMDRNVVAAAAAALCNVACNAETKDEAVQAGALPRLLVALREESRPEVADDIVACIGVLTSAFAPGAQAAIDSDVGIAPLLEALRLGHDWPVLASTVVDVICGLVVLGVTGTVVAPQLLSNVELCQQDLPRLLSSEAPDVRSGALKLCLMLTEADGGRAALAGVISAAQGAADLEPPGPPPLPFDMERRRKGQKLQLCVIPCESVCCFPMGLGPQESPPAGLPGLPAGLPAGLSPQQPPSRREMAEELVRVLG